MQKIITRVLVATIPFWSTVAFALNQDSQSASESNPGGLDTFSVAGTPLFGYEAVQLTESVLKAFGERLDSAGFAHLFRPGDSFNDVRRNNSCKAFPGDASWPSKDAWNALNGTLGGALIQTVPLAAPCYKSWGVYDAKACASIIEKYPNPYYQ